MLDMMIYYVFNLSTVSIGGQFESRSACDSKDKTAFNRKPLFTGNGTYSSDVSNDVSHVLTNFVTKL
jgi:hypothetical protein